MRALNYLLLALIISATGGCISSKKHLERGDYDDAIRKTVKLLKKNPKKQKYINILEKAYNTANQRDLEEIKNLKLSASPDRWDKIYNVYVNLDSRQNLVKTLPYNLSQRFTFDDYSLDIVNAKQKAAEYHYTNAVSLLKKNERLSARNAYEELQKVKKYYNDYKDVNTLLEKAELLGTAVVLYKVVNKMPVPVPPFFEDKLKDIDFPNQKWLSYTTAPVQNHDYIIKLNIEMITISPEKIKETNYTETKEIQDGWEYVLDANGNVIKDSLGNDIKKPKYKTISCMVSETRMHKGIKILAKLEFINNSSGKVLEKYPIDIEDNFVYMFAIANGDLDALKSETRKKLENKSVPFPTDLDMIANATPLLVKKVEKGIRMYDYLFK